MIVCGYVPSGTGGLAGMLDYVDCQAQTIGTQGYLALAAPGSVASITLTALLTILVALYGYRLLLGYVPGVRVAVLTLVKIGIVVAFATNWSAYRTVFYNVVLHGPAEVASVIGGTAGLPGAGGGLVAHLDAADQQFQALAVADVGGPFPYQQSGIAPPLFFGFDTFAIGSARVVYIVSALGAFAGVRLTAGLLLALGPFFIAFLLFEATRGLFIGWLRMMIGASLGALATAMVLGVELALLEPWLVDVVARRTGGQAIPGVPAQLLAATIVFSIALVVVVGAVARVAWALDLTGKLASSFSQDTHTATSSVMHSGMSREQVHTASNASQPRAAAIVDAVNAMTRREAASAVEPGAIGAARVAGQGVTTTGSVMQPQATATGRQATGGSRRTGMRISASAARRDKI